LPPQLETREQRLIAHQDGLSVHAQGLLKAGNDEGKSRLTGLEDVAERVDPAVSGCVGKEQPPLVEDGHEAGRAPSWRHVAPPPPVRGGDEHEGRPGDELAAVAVDMVELLALDGRHRWAVQPAQILLCRA
jgi:hypothetical protein